MPRIDPAGFEAVDRAISAGAEQAFAFLERLVAAPSTVGEEAKAQQVVADELDRLGFGVSAVPVPPGIAGQGPAGVAQASYAGRDNVLGLSNPGGSPSLLLNGHVDVVPAEAAVWSGDPFEPVTAGGWLRGRGAGDMKGGFAMGLLAVAALRAAMPGAVSGELGFLSVIEEECTGNGTFAAASAGVLGDAVVLLEPTGLDLLLGGVGILWAEIELDGVPAHAESADRAVNPVHSVPVILRALAGLESDLNTAHADQAFGEVGRPYNINVGTIRAGDWASSVPARAVMRVRAGFPRGWTADEAFTRVADAVQAAAAADPWLAAHPPRLRQSGFRAEGYLLAHDHPLADAVAAAHTAAHGAAPRRIVLGSTTDARYYLNQFGRPALAYGPLARNIHAADEAVELASVVAGARSLARFIAGYFAGGGLPSGPALLPGGPGTPGAAR
ncbi:MAG: M20/M25/M40 family metallo-hydrolase [Gemmatimonadota bacterium]